MDDNHFVSSIPLLPPAQDAYSLLLTSSDVSVKSHITIISSKKQGAKRNRLTRPPDGRDDCVTRVWCANYYTVREAEEEKKRMGKENKFPSPRPVLVCVCVCVCRPRLVCELPVVFNCPVRQSLGDECLSSPALPRALAV